MAIVDLSRLSRRQVLRGAGVGLLGLAAAPVVAACSGSEKDKGSQAQGGGKKAQLRILQWSHFVPVYDQWFDKWAKDWGAKNNVDVTVDHMPHLDMPARLAAEVAAKSGHDLIEMAGQVLTYRYTDQLADMSDIVDYAVQKLGAVEPIGKKLANVNGKWVGVPNFYIMIAPFVRKDLFQEVGYDWTKVTTWDQYLEVGRKLKEKNHPAGLAISQCNDANHNWRAIMWCFGASEVAEDGKTVTVDSAEMKEFLKFARAFYKDANTPEVFAWDDAADNRWLASGVGGFIHDALSSYRSIEGQNKQLFDNIAIAPVPKGPKAQLSMADSNVYIIWNFAPKENQEAAKSFLRYYFDNYKEAFIQSTGYNMPMYANMFQRPMPIVGEDPRLQIIQEYRGGIIDTFGHPGPPTSQATEVLANFVIPNMVGIAVRGSGDAAINDAIGYAKEQMAKFYK